MVKSKFDSRELDKFYTKDSVSQEFCQMVYELVGNQIDMVIEPSAGGGSFIPSIKKYWQDSETIFLDIEPEHPDVTRIDFLDYRGVQQNAIVIGNPPFGKNSSLAVKFFNHSAALNVEWICLILPRTFMKPRFWNRLSMNYTLIKQEILDKNSFTLDGKTWDVPCVAQIWKREPRECNLPKELSLFWDIGTGDTFIRRAGGRAGQIVESYTESSTYRVNCSEQTKSDIIRLHPEITKLASMTAGVRSITLLEVEDVLLGRYKPF